MRLGFIEVSGLTKPRLGPHGKAPSPWGEGWGEGSVLKCLAWNTQRTPAPDFISLPNNAFSSFPSSYKLENEETDTVSGAWERGRNSFHAHHPPPPSRLDSAEEGKERAFQCRSAPLNCNLREWPHYTHVQKYAHPCIFFHGMKYLHCLLEIS
jgi:hypothetical protein